MLLARAGFNWVYIITVSMAAIQQGNEAHG